MTCQSQKQAGNGSPGDGTLDSGVIPEKRATLTTSFQKRLQPSEGLGLT